LQIMCKEVTFIDFNKGNVHDDIPFTS
jgi:hypothetical protein